MTNSLGEAAWKISLCFFFLFLLSYWSARLFPIIVLGIFTVDGVPLAAGTSHTRVVGRDARGYSIFYFSKVLTRKEKSKLKLDLGSD